MDNRFQEEFPSSSGAFDDDLFEAENSSSEEIPINSSSGAQTFGDTVTSDNSTSPQATTGTAAENKNNEAEFVVFFILAGFIYMVFGHPWIYIPLAFLLFTFSSVFLSLIRSAIRAGSEFVIFFILVGFIYMLFGYPWIYLPLAFLCLLFSSEFLSSGRSAIQAGNACIIGENGPPTEPSHPTFAQNQPSSTANILPSNSVPWSPNADLEPESKILIQYHLVWLLHARQCSRENQECALPLCKLLKDVLEHIASCQAGEICSFTHCSSSKKILSHFDHCNRTDCEMCLPLKPVDRKNNPNPSMNSENQPPNPLHSSLPASKQTPHCETIKTLLELLTSCRDGENCSVAQCSALKNIIWLGIGSKGVDGLNPPKSGISAETCTSNLTQESMINVPLQAKFPSSPVTVDDEIFMHEGEISSAAKNSNNASDAQTTDDKATLDNPTPPQATATETENNTNVQTMNVNMNKSGFGTPHLSTDSATIVGVSQLTLNSQPNQITNNVAPEETVSNSQKEWQKQVNSHLREHWVTKLKNSIFPTRNATDKNLPHGLLEKLDFYARKVENDVYNAAESIDQYYHELAVRYYQIMKELDERRQKRKEQEERQKNQLQQTQM